VSKVSVLLVVFGCVLIGIAAVIFLTTRSWPLIVLFAGIGFAVLCVGNAVGALQASRGAEPDAGRARS
jgi:uncharacterized membrane protein